jgi:hypothetical protein
MDRTSSARSWRPDAAPGGLISVSPLRACPGSSQRRTSPGRRPPLCWEVRRHPVPDAMPPRKSIRPRPEAGMSIVRPTVGLLNPFRERAHYGVCYAVGAQLFPDAACVSFWWVNTEEDRRYASAVMTDRSNQGVQRVEVIDGNRVTIHDLAKTYHVVWSSGSKVVNVIFYRAAFHAGLGEQRARAAEASPEMRRELLRQYLLRYPSR